MPRANMFAALAPVLRASTGRKMERLNSRHACKGSPTGSSTNEMMIWA